MGDLERFEGRKKQTPRHIEWDPPECYWPNCENPIRTYFLHKPGRCWKGVCVSHRPDGLSNVTRTVYAKDWDGVETKTKRAIMNNLCER